ncbi:MAG: DUF952 domain-containing protein [Vicinamibacterales bacterium]
MAGLIIYKIVDSGLWETARAIGRFTGAPVDQQDGFIHFSTAAQVRETAERHFAGLDGLLLVAVDAAALGESLRWEPSRGGQLFPHLYGDLPLTAVRAEHQLTLDGSGTHAFPPLG